MGMLKRAGLAVSVMCLFTGAVSADPAETMKAAGEDASWLFIQTAGSAKFDGSILVLENVSPVTTMFSDRPVRVAETIPTESFVAGWAANGPDSFESDPPNAALTIIVDGALRTTTVILSEPQLEGATLTFKAQPLEGELPAMGAQTSIFFDDIHWEPGGFGN